MRNAPTRPAGLAAFTACLIAFGATVSAQQYTQQQAEACTPDALKFCSAELGDVGRAAACVKSHFAELSPACQTAFNAATAPAAPMSPAPAASAAAPMSSEPPRRVARAEPMPARRVKHHRHSVRESEDTRKARHALAVACGTQYVSPDLCRFTASLIRLAQ